MKIVVLKVRHEANLDELAQVIRRGRTLDGSDGGRSKGPEALHSAWVRGLGSNECVVK